MDQKSPEPPKILDKMSMATMTSPIIFWSHILKLGILWWIFVTLCAFFPQVPTWLHSTLFWWGFFPITVECHRSMMVIIATRPKLCNTIYIWHKHDTIMEDLGVIVYLLLHCGGGFRLEDHGVYFCAAIYLVAEFQKWKFFFFFLFFFFLPFPERVTFMTHQVMPSLTGQSGLAVFWRHIFVPGTKCTTWWKL